MERRSFFGWIGKLSLALGLGYLVGNSEEVDEETPQQVLPQRNDDFRARMNGRACHDFRMISSDRSIIFDRDIYHA